MKNSITGLMLLLGFLTALLLLLSIRKKSPFPKEIYLTEGQMRVVEAIAKHETGNYTSRVYKENNNLFGMKNPKRRQTTSKGADYNNYAIYDNIDDSVEDFILWFKFHKAQISEDLEQTVRFMKDKGYFEDSFENYFNGTKRWLQ